MVSTVTAPSCLDAMYGDALSTRLSTSRVLVVGAGGVGCELLKNLALTGFPSITIVDLDTVDVSNLNRQFLFRRHHVGKSKAIEAAAAVRSIVPGTDITGIIANIKDPRFGVSFFQKFTIVCNALDNLEARRYVNRMCLAANVPLVESGSTGFNGQVQLIARGVECYDCTDRPTPKTYAVCTIRSTPDKPVHCIVWAKFLYNLIFGEKDEANLLNDLDGATANGGGKQEEAGKEGEKQKDAQKDAPKDEQKREQSDAVVVHENHVNGNYHDVNHTPAKKAPPKRVRFIQTDTPDSFAHRVCERVFMDDIEEQRAMKHLWKTRKPPVPYRVNDVADHIDLDKVNILEQTVWSKKRSATVLKAVLKRIATKRKSEIGTLTFDKDDRDAMLFVTAAANLRANAYGVPLQSPFEAKGIAGNIVHAIATTNAMVGGIVVLEVLKVLASGDGDYSRNSTVFVSKTPRGQNVRLVVCPEPMRKPNPKCLVCSEKNLQLETDVNHLTLSSVVVDILQKKLCILQPSINVASGDQHSTVYECGEGLEEDEIEDYNANLKRKLSELGAKDGSQLVIDDFAQNLKFTMLLRHKDREQVDDEDPEKAVVLKWTLSGDTSDLKEAKRPPIVGCSKKKEEEEDDVDEVTEVPLQKSKEALLEEKLMSDIKAANSKKPSFVVVEDGKKRGLEENGTQPVAKKARVEGAQSV